MFHCMYAPVGSCLHDTSRSPKARVYVVNPMEPNPIEWEESTPAEEILLWVQYMVHWVHCIETQQPGYAAAMHALLNVCHYHWSPGFSWFGPGTARSGYGM